MIPRKIAVVITADTRRFDYEIRRVLFRFHCTHWARHHRMVQHFGMLS